MCKIAFITFAHNAENSIRKSVESVLNQTHKNLAYYLINNESTDNTWEVMCELAEKDSRIITVQGKNTMETLPEFIAQIKDCKYFATLDSDDWYEADFAEKLIGFAEEQSLDIAVCGSEFYRLEDKSTAFRKVNRNVVLKKEEYWDNMYEIFPHFRAIWAKIFKIELLGKMDLSNYNKLAATNVFYGEDQLFCHASLKSAERIGMINEILHAYLIYPESVSYRIHPQKLFAAAFLIESLEDFLTYEGKISETNKELLAEVCMEELRFSAENILQADADINHKYSQLLAVAKSAAFRKHIDSDETTKEFIINLMISSIIPTEVNKELAELFFNCVELLNSCYIVNKIRSDIDRMEAEVIRRLDRHLLIDQIEKIIMLEKATDVLQIGADFEFSRIRELPVYDMIIIRDVVEHLEVDDTMTLLEILLQKVKKQVLVISPIYSRHMLEEGGQRWIRKYHPLTFHKLDFSYSLHMAGGQYWQMYNIFPKVPYDRVICDNSGDAAKQRSTISKKKLKIAYIIPHHNVTGGIKAAILQMKHLALNGHTVKAYYRKGTDEDCQSALPEWSGIKEGDISEQHVITTQNYSEYIHDVDVIVLTWIDDILEFKDAKIPVVLWEQGSPRIFGDFGKALYSLSDERNLQHYQYRQPVHIMAVSSIVSDILNAVYNREAHYFPNGIDAEFYRPGIKAVGMPVIMIMGSTSMSFKGIEFAFDILNELQKQGSIFKVCWVSPEEVPVRESAFEMQIFVKPQQEELARLYREATVFLSTSLYEAFSLPPLEAMSSGTAVVAADSGGIREYARTGDNCILFEQGDTAYAVAAIKYLLENEQGRNTIEEAGRSTALDYSFDKVVTILEDCLCNICCDA